MQQAAVVPPKIMASTSGPDLPPRRVADMSGIVSLKVRHLFPEIPREIYLRGDDLSAIRQATERTLADVDMTMIKGKPIEGIDKQVLRMAYDSNGVYFALDVHDTTGQLENSRPVREFWFNDCIEIFIDSMNTKYSAERP